MIFYSALKYRWGWETDAGVRQMQMSDYFIDGYSLDLSTD